MSTFSTCDVISFSIQGHFFRVTCAGWRDLSNHTRKITIRSRGLMKLRQNLVTLTRKFPWKSYSTTHVLPFLSSNPKILKVFPKPFAVTKTPSKIKKRGKKSKRRGEERKQKEEVKTVEILLYAHTRTLEANILRWDQKAVECTTWKRLLVSFSSL